MEEGVSDGHIIAFDLSGVQMGHVARLGIFSIKNMLYYLQDAMPFRLKGLHFFNIVPFVDKIVFLMKPFMKKELWDVFHLHSTMDSFHKFVDADVLPKDYPKGEAESLEYFHKQTFKHLVELKQYFLEEERTRRINAQARPGKGKSGGVMSSVTGNFKKLDID